MNERPQYETLGDLTDSMMQRADGDYLKASYCMAQMVGEYYPEFISELVYVSGLERLCRHYLHLRYISGLGLPPTLSQQLQNTAGRLALKI